MEIKILKCKISQENRREEKAAIRPAGTVARQAVLLRLLENTIASPPCF